MHSKRFLELIEYDLSCFKHMLIDKNDHIVQNTKEFNINKLHHLFEDEDLFKFCKDSRILDIVENFCGPDIIILASMFINKPPDTGEKSEHPLHQDLAYLPLKNVNSMIQVWTALVDCNQHNGTICIVPGSHKLGLLKHVANNVEVSCDYELHINLKCARCIVNTRIGSRLYQTTQRGKYRWLKLYMQRPHSLLLSKLRPHRLRLSRLRSTGLRLS